MIKKIIAVILFLLLIAVAFILYNTFSSVSKQIEVASIPEIALDDEVVKRFSQAIRLKTISKEDPSAIDSTEFKKFSELLVKSFPLTDSLLEKKVFNEFSFLYKWQGSNSQLKPALMMGHLDVVPVDDVEIESWQQPPFSGNVVDGQIWGRGTIDDKVNVFGTLEAVELLLKEGFRPERTIYLAFGHDEENLGVYGARTIASYLKNNGVQLEFVLDEGYSIVEDMIPGMTLPVALIGIAEKGYTSLKLTVNIEGGHSSMPKPETAIDVLAKAVSHIRKSKFPAILSGPMSEFADFIGPEMPFINRMAFANRTIFKPLIVSSYEQSTSGNALMRTTVAPTIFRAGQKENVIPQQAEAIINLRIIPGETMQSVKDKISKIVNDDRVVISLHGNGNNPSAISGTDTKGFEIIHKSIREVFPKTLVAPNLVIAATDSRYFKDVSDHIYRFAPIRLNPDNISTFHGVNEHISIVQYKDAIRFYRQVILNCQ